MERPVIEPQSRLPKSSTSDCKQIVLLMGDGVAALRLLPERSAAVDLVIAEAQGGIIRNLKALWEPMFEAEGHLRATLLLICNGSMQEWCEEFLRLKRTRVEFQILYAEPSSFRKRMQSKRNRKTMERWIANLRP